ncbi:hypothetical protein OG413_41330 [Streptomyces sp. NBC_01433]|uniref:hypothetical protein n=1 Tax=Streptomyces sp. NBC_01433 TaxID=2903864 RepID=UPI00224F2B52|nr:hypothetical protein [Streptomyces sp. NBC_01433]MCX4681646.1 hypothetical protein [Streptomyces sp. NBC_01433]
MQFLITDDSRRILTAIDVPDIPDGDASTIGIERADRPDLLYVGADLYADGTITVGHWPDGEDWDRLVHTAGVPDQCGHTTPALPAELTYTRAQVSQALADARARLEVSTAEAAALDLLTEAALAALGSLPSKAAV